MESGKCHFVIGLGHGDEAKAVEVDCVADELPDDTMVVRYNGANNAGHTRILQNGKKFVSHGLPSGVGLKNPMYIASDCLVDMPGIEEEMEEAAALGYPVGNQLRISSQASVTQPHHRLLDLATMYEVGTTGKGVGPAYGDQCYRMEGKRQLNIQLGDLLDDPEHFFGMMEQNLLVTIDRVRSGVYGTPPELIAKIFGEDKKSTKKKFVPAEEMAAQRKAFNLIAPMIDRDPQMLLKYLRSGYNALFEGAQALGIEKRHGANPFVTASRVSPAAGFDSANLPLDPALIGTITGVYKATPSRVGWGPFPSEFGGLESEQYCMAEGGNRYTREIEQQMYGERLAAMLMSGDPLEKGKAARVEWGEYGATSGRPRRVGATDLPWLENAVKMLGVNRVAISAMDRLQLFSRTKENGIPYVDGYRNGTGPIEFVPNTNLGLRHVTADIAYADAFSEDITTARSRADLPEEAVRFIRKIEERIQAQVHRVGVGPRKNQRVRLAA